MRDEADSLEEMTRKIMDRRNAKAKTMAGPMEMLERFDRKLKAEARAAVRKRSPRLPSQDLEAFVTMEMYKMMNHTRKDELNTRMRTMFSRKRRK